MAVGTQPTVGGVNDQLTQLALQWRNVAAQTLNLFTTINELAGDTGLTAGFEAMGFTSGDAASAATLLGYMNTLAGVYAGTASQATDFAFANALSALWAGMSPASWEVCGQIRGGGSPCRLRRSPTSQPAR